MKQGNPTTTVPQLISAFSDQLMTSARHLEKASEIASEVDATLSEIVTQLRRSNRDLVNKMRVAQSTIHAKEVAAIAGTIESIVADVSTLEWPPNIEKMVFPAMTLARHIAIEHSPLSTRVKNALALRGLRTLGDVADQLSQREARSVRNVGNKSLQELKDTLNKAGLSLRPE
jgi:DNA-directed RNA polymerase alpha subunit